MTDDELRAAVMQYIHDRPLKQAGLIILDAAKAFMDKQTSYSPHGSQLCRFGKDGLTVCVAVNDVAPMLSTAYDALKEAIGA